MASRFMAATSLLMLSLISSIAAQMTPEEKLVRSAYAKLSYAAALGVLVENVLSAQSGRNNALGKPSELREQMNSNLVFIFDDFKTGSLADIGNVRWDALVTKPQQELIGVIISNMPYRMMLSKGESMTEMIYGTANWQRHNESFEADWNTPVRNVVQELPKDTHKPEVVYNRYAAYTVTARLASRQRTYLALFLFGRNPDGTQAIFPIDHILGMGTLNYFMEHSVYPQPLLETHLREWPGVREWIASAGVSSNSTARDIVCDGASGKCGIPANLLKEALALPIDPESRQFLPRSSPQGARLSKMPSSAPPASSCSTASQTFNITPTPTTSANFDHKLGNHSATTSAVAACTYSSKGTQFCSTQCSVAQGTGASSGETGTTTSGSCHVVGLGWDSGSGVAANGGVTCSGTLTGGAAQCATPQCNCNVSVGIGVVTSNSLVIWSSTVPVTASCNSVPDPTYKTCGGNSNVPCGGGGGSCCDSGICGYRQICDGTCDCVYASPIVIDTTGHGFRLTAANDGVEFDILGEGRRSRIAWTAADSGNALLALDRNGNGFIDSGKELFGNMTEQPKSSDQNGFLALAEFDKPENGGNQDGIIDERDAVFSRLLLWIDENHDGISQPNELHTLPEMGVFSIGLRFRDDKHHQDQYGNWFHYRAALNPNPVDGESKDGRWTYDVFFQVAKANDASSTDAISAAEHRLR